MNDQDDEDELEIPVGPDHYDPLHGLVKKTARTTNWAASKSKRFEKKVINNPGPGAYGSQHQLSISMAQLKMREEKEAISM